MILFVACMLGYDPVCLARAVWLFTALHAATVMLQALRTAPLGRAMSHWPHPGLQSAACFLRASHLCHMQSTSPLPSIHAAEQLT